MGDLRYLVGLTTKFAKQRQLRWVKSPDTSFIRLDSRRSCARRDRRRTETRRLLPLHVNPHPEGAQLPDDASDTPGEPINRALSDALDARLARLAASGWAVEWERDSDQVVCHLILFSSRRVHGVGPDAEAAGRDALSKLEADE